MKSITVYSYKFHLWAVSTFIPCINRCCWTTIVACEVCTGKILVKEFFFFKFIDRASWTYWVSTWCSETFLYTHFSTCHQPRAKRGFIEGETLRLFAANSSKHYSKREFNTSKHVFSTEGTLRISSRNWCVEAITLLKPPSVLASNKEG